MNENMMNFFETNKQQECLNILLHSGQQCFNGIIEANCQLICNQDKNKRLSLDIPQPSIINLNQCLNQDTNRKDSIHRRGTNIEIMDMDTSPIINLYEKYPRLTNGQFFKIQHLLNYQETFQQNYNLTQEQNDQSFTSKTPKEQTPDNIGNKKKEQKQNNINNKYQNYQSSATVYNNTETAILKEINLIIQYIRNTKSQNIQQSKSQKEIMKDLQKTFYVKLTSQNSTDQSMYLFIRITPFQNNNKIFFIIEALNKTLYQSYCNLESLYNQQKSIIRGFADDSFYSIHYLVKHLNESKSFASLDFSKTHIDPLLTQVFILQNTMQILYEISDTQQPFNVKLSSQLLIDFLKDEIVQSFRWDTQSRKIQLKIESEKDVPSRINTDFDKIKFILTVIIQNFMNFLTEGQDIIISLKNQNTQNDEQDISYINETQNIINNNQRQAGQLIQFSVSYSSISDTGEELQRIQQVFLQSLNQTQDQLEFNRSYTNQSQMNTFVSYLNLPRKSSFFNSKAQIQNKKGEKIFETIDSIQVSNMISMKLVTPLCIQNNIKNNNIKQIGLQYEKTAKGLPCISFVVENQSNNIEREHSKSIPTADISTNLLNRQTTDGLSPNQISQKIFRNNNKVDEDLQFEFREMLTDINTRHTQTIDYHKFPKPKSITQLNQTDSRKLSMVSQLCSTNELLKIEDIPTEAIFTSKKRLSLNPKSLVGFPQDLQVTTTAQSSQNHDEFEDNHQIITKKQTPKLENIPEIQQMEQSRENENSQNENNAQDKFSKDKNYTSRIQSNNDHKISKQIESSQISSIQTIQQRLFDKPFQMNQKDTLQTMQVTNANTLNINNNKNNLLQNRISISKKVNDSSYSISSPPKKQREHEHYSYKDLPSSLSLSQKNQYNNISNKLEDLINYQEQNMNLQSPKDSIINISNLKQQMSIEEKSDLYKIHTEQNKTKRITVKINNEEQVFNLTQQEYFQMNSNQKISFNDIQARGVSFGTEKQQNQEIFQGGNIMKIEQSYPIFSNATPLFTSIQQQKSPVQLEIGKSAKLTQNLGSVMNSNIFYKKQILFVDKHKLYHDQFQTVLSKYSKECEEDKFESAFTIEECISYIEQQYQINKFQYPYIIIDNKLINDGPNTFIKTIKQIFQIQKVQFQSQIFICSNQNIDQSLIQNYGIAGIIKKPITIQSLEENQFILMKKPLIVNNTANSQSFSPLYINK